MNDQSFLAVFDHPFSVRVTWLMLHFVWQGMAIGLTVFIINFIAERSARFRYAVAVGGMLAMAASVVATSLIKQPTFVAPSSDISLVELMPERPLSSGSAIASIDLDGGQLQSFPPRGSGIAFWAPAVTAVYTLGVTLMLLRLACSQIGVSRLRRDSLISSSRLATQLRELAAEMGLRVEPTLRVCERVLVPFVVGIVKPTILLPASAIAGMTQAELDAILTHELAHLRRGDVVINYLQRMFEAMLFFHPAVWYVSRIITTEREICCDDIVLRRCSRNDYASALIRLAEECTGLAAEAAVTTVLAATGASPSQLKRRVMRILGVKSVPRSNRWGVGILTVCLATMTATAFHSQAQTKDDGSAISQSTQQQDEVSPSTSEDAGTDHATSEPLLVYLQGDALVVSAPQNGISRLTGILNFLVEQPSTRVHSIDIRRVDDRQVMTIRGSQLDFEAIQPALRKQHTPLAMKIVEELKKMTDAANPNPFLGAVQLEAVGDSIIMRGERQDVNLVKKIIEGIEDTKMAPSETNTSSDNAATRVPVQDDTAPADDVAKIPTPKKIQLSPQQAVTVFQALLTMKMQEKELVATLGPNHPRRKELRENIELLEDQLGLDAESTQDLGPVRIEAVDENVIVRGKKEDVDRLMKLIEGVLADTNKNERGKTPDDDDTVGRSAPASRRIQLTDTAKPQDVTLALTSFLEGQGIAEGTVVHRVETDDTRNVLLIQASETQLEKIKGFLHRRNWISSAADLGTTDDVVHSVHVLRNAAADEVKNVLDEIFRDLLNDKTKLTIVAEPQLNRLVVAAPEKLQRHIAAIVQRLDQPPQERPDTKFVAYPLKKLTAESVRKLLHAVFSDATIRVAADAETNRVLIWATEEQHRRIANLIKRLDQVDRPILIAPESPQPATSDRSELNDSGYIANRGLIRGRVQILRGVRQGASPSGHLLFPLEVERAMMMDAMGINPPKR